MSSLRVRPAAEPCSCRHCSNRAWQKILFAKGWIAPSWPKAYGGTGWSIVQKYIYDSECAEAGTPTLPMMGQAKLGWTAVAGGSLGIVALVTGLLAANVTTTRAGAMLFTLAIVTTAIHHLRMMLIGRVRPATE